MLFQRLTAQSISSSEADAISNTLVRMREAHFNLLSKWGVLSLEQVQAFIMEDHSLAGQLDPTANIQKLLEGYQKEDYTDLEKRILLTRLIPQSEVTTLRDTGIPSNTLFRILQTRFSIIPKIKEAKDFVEQNKGEVYGTRNAWRIVIGQGLEGAEDFVKNAKIFVKQNKDQIGGAGNAWTIAIGQGLEGSEPFVKNVLELLNELSAQYGGESQAWRHIIAHGLPQKNDTPPASMPWLRDVAERLFRTPISPERWITRYAPWVETGVFGIPYLFAVFGVPAALSVLGIDPDFIQSLKNTALNPAYLYIGMNLIFSLLHGGMAFQRDENEEIKLDASGNRLREPRKKFWAYRPMAYQLNEKGKWEVEEGGVMDWVKLFMVGMHIHLPFLGFVIAAPLLGSWSWIILAGGGMFALAGTLHAFYNALAIWLAVRFPSLRKILPVASFFDRLSGLKQPAILDALKERIQANGGDVSDVDAVLENLESADARQLSPSDKFEGGDAAKRFQAADEKQQMAYLLRLAALSNIFQSRHNGVLAKKSIDMDEAVKTAHFLAAEQVAAISRDFESLKKLHDSKDKKFPRSSGESAWSFLFHAGMEWALEDETTAAARAFKQAHGALELSRSMIDSEDHKVKTEDAEQIFRQGVERGRKIKAKDFHLAIVESDRELSLARVTRAGAGLTQVSLHKLHHMSNAELSILAKAMLNYKKFKDAAPEGRTLTFLLDVGKNEVDRQDLKSRLEKTDASIRDIFDDIFPVDSFERQLMTDDNLIAAQQDLDPSIKRDINIVYGIALQRVMAIHGDGISKISMDVYTDEPVYTEGWARNLSIRILWIVSQTQVIVISEGIDETLRSQAVLAMQQ